MERVYLKGTLSNARTPAVRFWPGLVLIAALTAVLYAAVMKDLVLDWWENPDYNYAFLVPLFVGYVLWQNLHHYETIEIKPSNWGLLILLAAIALLIVGTLGADYFTSRFSLCVLLAGMVVYLGGWHMLRALAFPLSYTSLMIPLPGIVQNQVTYPLQLMASRLAASFVELAGVPVFRQGNLLSVPHYSVEVAQACSGIRSLLALLAMGIAYGYVAERRTWARVGLVVVLVPIAVFTNSLRIMVITLLGYALNPAWAEGFLHFFSGWLIFVLALGLLFLAHSLMGGRSNSTLRGASNA